MLSGGLGSTASLWRILTSGKECKILFAENMFSKNLETTRRKFIKDLMLDGKASNGVPLATGSKEEGYKTWISSLATPRGSNILPRRARITLLTSLAYEYALNDPTSSQPLTLVWGSVFDCYDLFEQLKIWNVKHIVPFPNRETALFCLSHGEIVSDTLISRHYVTPREFAPDCMLLYECLNQVCSCWDNNMDTKVIYESRLEDLDKPFLSMCGKCSGCERWYDAVQILRQDMPNIRFGSKSSSGGDEDRNWKTCATMKELPRRSFNVADNTPNKTPNKKTKGRPKKSKIQVEDIDEEKEENEEEIDLEKDENEDENDIESEDGSESEEEFNYENEDEDENVEDEDIEIPDDFLEGYDDEGYDSDVGSKKRKRKKQ
jgi:hypothetical protein